MMFLFLFLLFVIVAAALWFQGLWSNAVTLINLLVAMLIATNLWEPICTLIESFGAGSFTYLLDFVVLWFLFVFSFVFLRLITDLLSRTRVKFEMPVEMAGRSILAIWCAWLVVCFTAFSLQMAPLNSSDPDRAPGPRRTRRRFCSYLPTGSGCGSCKAARAGPWPAATSAARRIPAIRPRMSKPLIHRASFRSSTATAAQNMPTPRPCASTARICHVRHQHIAAESQFA